MDKLITVIVKPGQTFKGVTYYEPTKFDVTPEYARHLVETGIVTVQPPPQQFTWREVKPGVFVTVAVKNGKTYLGHPLPKAFAEKMGMTTYEPYKA